ncbi:MAG: TadE/TadG family type IV pilus assembly protein [Pseudomonadota bacterium]
MALWRRLAGDRRGAALVEFTLIAALFLFLLFALVEGALLLMSWNQTEKAVQAAVRSLVVRPPVAAAVPATRDKNPALDPVDVRFGAGCEGANSPCAPVAPASCTLTVASGATTCADVTGAQAAFDRMRALSPFALRPGSDGTVTFTYRDTGLGFVGGPYIPLVEVRVEGLRYRFVAMAGLSQLLGGNTGPNVAFPPIAATLVGEDLAEGAPS